jgi:hypothetical protein
MIRGINFSYVCHGLAFFLLVSTEDFSSAKPSPLLESDGTSIKVLGFSPKQRAVFIHVLMRYIVRLQTGHKNSLLFFNG